MEIMLAVSLLALILLGFVGALAYGMEGAALAGRRARALALAQEGLEAVRNIRDDDYSHLLDGTHGLEISGGQWQLAGSSDLVEGFMRHVSISSVDETTKQVSSTVDWQQNLQRQGSLTLTAYLTNWMLPIPPSIGDWSLPLMQSSVNATGSHDGLKIRIQDDLAYLIRADGSPDFMIYNVSDPASPVALGTLSLVGSPSDLWVSGSYAYVASNDNSRELQVIRVSNPANPLLVGSYNASGNSDATGVMAAGSTVYLARANGADHEFAVINAANPASPLLVGSTNSLSSGTGYEMVLLGQRIYMATSADSAELQIFNVANPALPTVTAYNLSGNSDARVLAAFGDTVALGRLDGQMALVDVSNPASPGQLGIYAGNDALRGIATDDSGQYAFLASDYNNAEFQVVDISDPASMTLVGSLNLASDLNGIAYHPDLDRAFAVGEDNSQELLIFAPQ